MLEENIPLKDGKTEIWKGAGFCWIFFIFMVGEFLESLQTSSHTHGDLVTLELPQPPQKKPKTKPQIVPSKAQGNGRMVGEAPPKK